LIYRTCPVHTSNLSKAHETRCTTALAGQVGGAKMADVFTQNILFFNV